MIQSLMSAGITRRKIILAGICAKMLLNYYENAAIVLSWSFILSLQNRETFIR